MTKETELRPYKFKSTGKTVFLRKVSVGTLMLDLAQENPKPLPPLQTVKMGGIEVTERNYAHPDYPAVVAAWEEDINTKAIMILLAGYVHVELSEQDKKDVKEYRARMQGILNLNGNDQQIWLRKIAITDDADLQDLMLTFRKTGQPTEEGVAAAADGFQDKT